MTTFEIRRCDICGATSDRRGQPATMLHADGWRRWRSRDVCANCRWDTELTEPQPQADLRAAVLDALEEIDPYTLGAASLWDMHTPEELADGIVAVVCEYLAGADSSGTGLPTSEETETPDDHE